MYNPSNDLPIHRTDKRSIPEHPFIQSELPRDTLERVSEVLELMQYLDLSKGMDHKAQLGLFRIHQTLSESVEYVCDNLKDYHAGKN